MIQGGCIMGLGDVVAQTAVEKRPWRQYESIRTIRFSFMGSILVAPVVRGWLLTLERIVSKAPGFISGSNTYSALAKVALDTAVFTPTILFYIISVVSALSGHSTGEIRDKLKRDYKDVVLTAWTIWPFVQTANFLLVPLNLRPLVVSVVAFFWNTYLAWKTNRAL